MLDNIYSSCLCVGRPSVDSLVQRGQLPVVLSIERCCLVLDLLRLVVFSVRILCIEPTEGCIMFSSL